MSFLRRPGLAAILLFVFVVLPLGAVEGWYGRVDYSGDAIPYLDIARAVQDGNWRLACNPLWGLGYPLLIAAIKPLFAPTPFGEWAAIHLLNLAIYAGCYASFLFLLRGIAGRERFDARIVLAGMALFLAGELGMDNVSRVGPDLAVTALFLLALGLLLRLLERPRGSTALLLGATLGFGYVVKTIFLPLSAAIVLVALVALFLRRHRPAVVVLTIAAAALFAVPYIAGLSRAMGRFTLGESGAINYAWHVNRLSLMYWQGGPSAFGRPLHPVTQLEADPPIYAFAEPFHVTYPAFFNPPYYYEGYRHFFSVKLQLRAIGANLLHLAEALRPLPIVYAVLLNLLAIALNPAPRRAWLRGPVRHWTLLVPALAGIALYLQVHLEARYLPGFLLVLAAVPLTRFFVERERWPKYLSSLVLAILIAGSAATVWTVNRSAFARASRHVRYRDDSQWKLAAFLAQHGLQPGDEVAVVGGPATHCTWAYVDRLRIVAELSADLYAPPDTGKDLFWNATLAERERMLALFAGTGAKLLVAPAASAPVPGWIPVPGSDVVIRDLR